MKNLKKFEVQDLNFQEIKEINGGGLIDWVVGGLVYDALKWVITENNYEYGKRIYETGSPGGAK